MLTLFVLAIALLHRQVVQIGQEKEVTEKELRKINEIRTAVQSIDSTYFSYDPVYKKHILKTQVKFNIGSSNIDDLDSYTKDELLAVRDTIKSFLDKLIEKDRKASYLLIIEGQASRDNYYYNNQLSYDRALSLFKFWFPNQTETTLQFYNLPCEVVIAGAGHMEGKPRAYINEDNQRFLIQIIPKPGIIDE
jgi:hypothetical protein